MGHTFKRCCNVDCTHFLTLRHNNCNFHQNIGDCLTSSHMKLMMHQWIRTKQNIDTKSQRDLELIHTLGGHKFYQIRGFALHDYTPIINFENDQIAVSTRMIDPESTLHFWVRGDDQVTGQKLYDCCHNEGYVESFIRKFGFYDSPPFGELLQWAYENDVTQLMKQHQWISNISWFSIDHDGTKKRESNEACFQLKESADGEIILKCNDQNLIGFLPGQRKPMLYKVQFPNSVPFDFEKDGQLTFK